MRVLTYSNWKQKIPFDNIVYKEVKRHSLKLNSYERAIMDVQIDFYRNNFSILQIMDHFKTLKTKEGKETFIKTILKRQDCIHYVPQCVVSYLKTKIKKEFSDYQSFFEILLNKAMLQPKKNLMPYVLKAILGCYYKPVMKKINKYRKMPRMIIGQKKLPSASYTNLARDHIERLQKDPILTKIYGKSNVKKTLHISVVDDYGYGEWQSKHVTHSSINRFFLYSNNNTLTDDELEHMIYFNVYPGYGYFYNIISEGTNNILFDNGATYLINGWAMYAMCHSRNSAYSTSRLIEGSKIVHSLLKKNLEDGYAEAYMFLLSKYPKQKAIQYMLDYSQYPGHYMSYVIGAFATEEAISSNFAINPADYVRTLNSINCGDFFALYHPKMQKLISETNIVAKTTSTKFKK